MQTAPTCNLSSDKRFVCCDMRYSRRFIITIRKESRGCVTVETVLAHGLTLIQILYTYLLIVYCICCHVVRHELDVN